MKTIWSTAAVLSLLIAAACSDRGKDDTQNFEENNAAPAAVAPSPDRAPAPGATYESDRSASSRADSSSGPTTRGARATVGRRSSLADRSEYARPAESSGRNAASATPAPRAPEWREVTIPEGTSLPLELQTALSSETSTIEALVRARLRQAIEVDGYTAIPAGTVVSGNVTDVERSGRVEGRARLSFAFHEMEMNNGREDLTTKPITYLAEQTKGEDATKIGGGALGGAIIGGILGGKKGAAKGAIIGGGAGTGVVLATRGKEVSLASGTDVTAILAEPLTVRVPAR